MAGRRSSVPSPSADSGRVAVPKLNKDPIQSLRSWPTVVTVHGQECDIPAMSAADWLTLLMKENLDPVDVFIELLPEQESLLFDGSITVEELYDLVLDVISLVSGRHWWVAMRLIGVARDSWDILGARMTLRHLDPTQLSLAAWLDALLLVTLAEMDPKDVTIFTMRLEAVPETEDAPAEELEMSADAFLAMGR